VGCTSRALARRREQGHPLGALGWSDRVWREFAFISVAGSVGSRRFAEGAAVCGLMVALRAWSESRGMETQHPEHQIPAR